MATPRKRLVDPVTPLFYHLASRCVRRSWLCGKDPISRKDFSHRKQWLIDRMRFLAQFFAIELHAYTIMSNHFHLVVFLDPKASLRWSDQQVVDRWLAVCPPRTWTGDIDLDAIPDLTARLLDDPERLLYLRAQLGSLSTFMKHLKQPIARRANQEDGCKGHFFEQRFYSGALLSERAIVAAMAYVDINPIRAAIEKTIEDCANSSIALRLADLDRNPDALDAALQPLVSGLEEAGQTLNITLRRYLEVARIAARPHTPSPAADDMDRWQQDVAALAHRQRAYGPAHLIARWLEDRGMRALEKPLSA